MRKTFAGILLMIYLGFSFFPNLIFLGVQIISDLHIGYQKEKLPCIKASETPLTGDFTYLFAIKKRVNCENHNKKTSNIPINHFDTTNILYFLPSDVNNTTLISNSTIGNYYYSRIFQIRYLEISTPPPKCVNA